MPITLPDNEWDALIAALAKHRLTVTESSHDDYLTFEVYGHPHVTVISYWPQIGLARQWCASWLIKTNHMTHAESGEGPTPAAAIEALLAEIAALAAPRSTP